MPGVTRELFIFGGLRIKKFNAMDEGVGNYTLCEPQADNEIVAKILPEFA
jgi:hypothetical protein